MRIIPFVIFISTIVFLACFFLGKDVDAAIDPKIALLQDEMRALGLNQEEVEVMTCIIRKESSFNPSAQNPVSSAAGLLAITKSTWESNSDYSWEYRYDWYANLSTGIKIYQRRGWQPWITNKFCTNTPDRRSYQLEKASRKAWDDPKTRKILTEHARKNFRKAQIASAESKHKNKRTVEDENEHGTCELQLKYRLIEYVKKYKDLPSRTRKGEGRKISKALTRRHGSDNEGFAYYGFPRRHRSGTNVELIAPNGEQYFFNYNKPDYSKSDIYDWMERNCPILTQVDQVPIYE